MTTLAQAVDDINQMFLDAWNAGTPAVNGGVVPEIRWFATEEGAIPSSTVPWARVTATHNDSVQRSLGGPGQRRFERRGIVTVQIFTPRGRGQGLSLAQQLATIARDAFEGKASPNGVWFQRVVVKDIGIDGPWEQTNVVATFLHDEIK